MSIVLNEELACLPGGFFTCRSSAPYELLSINQTLLTLSHTQNTEQLSVLSGGTLAGLVHPDDRERFEVLLKTGEAFAGAHTDALTFRLNTTDAAIRYASCFLHKDTGAELICGFLADATVQREEHLDLLRRKDLYHDLYRKIRLSEERFRFISSFAGVMFYEYDLSSRESSRFENSLDVLGYTEWEMQQIFAESKTTDCLKYLMTDEDYASISDFYERFNDSGEAEGELRIRRKDGSYHWFFDKRCLVLSQGGEGSFIRGCLWNADTTHQRISGLVESSERDGVTGLYNQSSGFGAIAAHLDEKGAENTAFVLFDLDRLKLINDTLGYAVGDELLHLVGTELVRAFSQGGVVGRFGGDEFYAFVSSAGEEESFLKRIRRLFASLREAKPLRELGHALSLCAGVVFSEAGDSAETLLSKAQRALSDAKLLGGGQCSVYRQSTPRAVDNAELMGLSEKKQFIHNAQKRIAGADGPFSVLSVCVEGFDLFCEWFGVRLADKYVAEISYALSELEAEHDALVSYFGEAGFGVLVPDRQGLLGALEGRLVGLARSLTKTTAFLPAVGVYPLGSAQESIGRALACAQEAASSVFGSTGGRVSPYKAPSPCAEMSERELLVALRDAIKKQQIQPYLSAAIDLESGRVVGAQMLCRWDRSDARTLEENDFLPTLGRRGLTPVLSQALWDKLFGEIAELKRDSGIQSVPVAITVTQADLRASDLVSTLEGMLEKHSLSKSDILLMLSEQDYLANEDLTDAEIARLRGDGYTLYLCDMRPAYAMLRRLGEVRVDGVCIRSQDLCAHGMREGEALRILQSLVPIAEERSLGLVVTGVSDKALALRLASLGIRKVTGDCYYPARSARSFFALLKNQQRQGDIIS